MRCKWYLLIKIAVICSLLPVCIFVVQSFIHLEYISRIRLLERSMKYIEYEFTTGMMTNSSVSTTVRMANSNESTTAVHQQQNETRQDIVSIPPLIVYGIDKYIHLAKKESIKYGKHRTEKAYMAIGIPTVSREWGKGYYLFDTLYSLINNINKTDLKLIVIVVYVTDFNQTWNEEIARKLEIRFKSLCEDGVLQIVKQQNHMYPNFSNFGGTFGDSRERTIWRSKQNIDFAFLMMYSAQLGTYYMQLEDDVISAENYFEDIKSFVEQQTSAWACIEVSNLGFIGKIFKSIHLPKFASFFLTFYDILPCDLLIGRVYNLLGQKKPIHSRSSLFQHNGMVSSLKNKIMPVIDTKFKHFGKSRLSISYMPVGDNPPAFITTDLMTMNEKIQPSHPYSKQVKIVKTTPGKTGNFFQISYKDPLPVKRIIVATGSENTKKYSLQQGELYISENGTDSSKCLQRRRVGRFVDGEFDSFLQGVKLPPKVSCIYIYSKKSHFNNCIIRQISIMLQK